MSERCRPLNEKESLKLLRIHGRPDAENALYEEYDLHKPVEQHRSVLLDSELKAGILTCARMAGEDGFVALCAAYVLPFLSR